MPTFPETAMIANKKDSKKRLRQSNLIKLSIFLPHAFSICKDCAKSMAYKIMQYNQVSSWEDGIRGRKKIGQLKPQSWKKIRNKSYSQG
jgi:hypothetical protein